MKKKLYVCIGLPGAGKSTWAEKMVKKNKDTIIISRDSLRTMLNGNYKFREELEYFVLDLSRDSIRLAMHEGYNIIVDETLLKYSHRAILYQDLFCENIYATEKELRKKYEIIFVVFKTGLDGNIQKNLSRRYFDNKGLSLKVWEKVIADMLKTYIKPNKRLDIYSKILYIK